MTYTEIKKWFEANEKSIPEILETDDRYRQKIKETVDQCIDTIESEIERLGAENIKKSKMAMACKTTMVCIREDLLKFPAGGRDKLPTLKEIKENK